MWNNVKVILLLLVFPFVCNIAFGQTPSAVNDTAFFIPFSIDTIHVTANDTGHNLCITSVYGSGHFLEGGCGDVIFQSGSELGKDSCFYVVCDTGTLLCDTGEVTVWVNKVDSLLPLLEVGKVWNVCIWFLENPPCSISLSLGRDTLIDSHIYTQVLQAGVYNCFGTFDSLAGWIREDGERVFFRQHNPDTSYSMYCSPNDSTEILLYDFSILRGDTLFENIGYEVADSFSVVTVDGIARKRWMYFPQNALLSTCVNYTQPFVVIGGIGNTEGLLSRIWVTFENEYGLGCVVKDSVLLYGSSCFYCPSVGISTLPNVSLTLYPNPTSGLCSLQLPNSPSSYSAAIYDLTGRKIKTLFTEQHFSNCSFNTSELSAGLYFVGVTDKSMEDGIKSSVWVSKLVKE